MSDFAENLRKAMFAKRCKAVDVSRATKIRPSVISRYLSRTNQPSSGNLFAIANYLGISPDALLSSSDAPESPQGARATSDKDKIIAVQNELIERLKKDVGRLEEKVKEWEEEKKKEGKRHAKKQAKKAETQRLIELLEKKGITITAEMIDHPTGSTYRDRAINTLRRELAGKNKLSQKSIEALREIIPKRTSGR